MSTPIEKSRPVLKSFKNFQLLTIERVQKLVVDSSLLLKERLYSKALIFMTKYHHHIVLAARISLTLSRHSSLSFIALGRSSGQQPVSSHSC